MELRMLLLAKTSSEMIGVDLRTGAMVRAQSFLQRGEAEPVPERARLHDGRTGRNPGGADSDNTDPPRKGSSQRGGSMDAEVDSASGAPHHGLAARYAVWETLDIGVFDVAVMLVTTIHDGLDPAQPEAVAVASLPRVDKQLRRRHVRRHLADVVAPERGPLLGFRGPSTPYWSLTGSHPSVALVELRQGVQLFRRAGEDSPRIRFQWGRSEERLPLLDEAPARALAAHERTNPGRILVEDVVGFQPAYLVACITPPVEGYSYKVAVSLLPKP